MADVERSVEGIERAVHALSGVLAGRDFERAKALEDEIHIAALEVIQDMGKRNSIKEANKIASYALATLHFDYPRHCA